MTGRPQWIVAERRVFVERTRDRNVACVFRSLSVAALLSRNRDRESSVRTFLALRNGVLLGIEFVGIRLIVRKTAKLVRPKPHDFDSRHF